MGRARKVFSPSEMIRCFAVIGDSSTLVICLFMRFVSATARCRSRSWSFPALRDRLTDTGIRLRPTEPLSGTQHYRVCGAL